MYLLSFTMFVFLIGTSTCCQWQYVHVIMPFMPLLQQKWHFSGHKVHPVEELIDLCKADVMQNLLSTKRRQHASIGPILHRITYRYMMCFQSIIPNLITTNMKDTLMNSTSKRQQRVSELLFSNEYYFGSRQMAQRANKCQKLKQNVSKTMIT